MPYRIVEVERLAPTLTRLVVEAPLVARKRQAGHFVIVRLDETGERIPLTIVDSGAAPHRGEGLSGTGAGTPTFMGIPGEGLAGVYSANEFLTRVNLMGAWRFPEYDTPVKVGREVAVVGGGNTAMDAVRVARRLGAERAYLVYRRSREEMPARAEEVHHAEEEGIELRLLTNPVRILGDADGWVAGLECVRMELGEPDASGRRKPVPVAGSEHVLRVQTVIEAVGQRPNPIVQSTTTGLDTGPRGVVRVSEAQATTRAGVFAGGDLARGGATVILAMRDGRRAAAAIHEYIGARDAPRSEPREAVGHAPPTR